MLELEGKERPRAGKQAGTLGTNPDPLPFPGAILAEGVPRGWGWLMGAHLRPREKPVLQKQVESETCERLWSKKGNLKGHQSEGARGSYGSWGREPGI